MARHQKQPESERDIIIPQPVYLVEHRGVNRAMRRRKGGKGWRMLRVNNVPYVRRGEVATDVEQR
ncbi:MAG TPA: hypothetical protein VHK27_12660 [Gammaproteobacteria bacterium]|nr:hypothetical protein [Gammaproteobacteria bacterium]